MKIDQKNIMKGFVIALGLGVVPFLSQGRLMADNSSPSSITSCSFRANSTALTCEVSDVLEAIQAQKELLGSNKGKKASLYVNVGKGRDRQNKTLVDERLAFLRVNLKRKLPNVDWHDSVTDGDKLEMYVKLEE